jgi:hypothetical protein
MRIIKLQGIPVFTGMNIGELVCRLSDLRAEYQGLYGQSQQYLRDYVTARQFPVDDRFEVWAGWCEKEYHSCTINEADVPLFGKMVDDEEPIRYERYEEVDWLTFLECFDDNTNEAIEMREKYSVTVDEVKETLIQTNFGSFKVDH